MTEVDKRKDTLNKSDRKLRHDNIRCEFQRIMYEYVGEIFRDEFTEWKYLNDFALRIRIDWSDKQDGERVVLFKVECLSKKSPIYPITCNVYRMKFSDYKIKVNEKMRRDFGVNIFIKRWMNVSV